MRKVSSAPSLVDVGHRASTEYHGSARMSAKSSSSGSLHRIGCSHPKEDTKRQGSATRVQTQALFSEIQSQAAPSDQVLPEEFAESARGIAGMDCFELYGGSKKAPALASTAEGSGEKEPEEQAAADDANAYALATCLNTPYTGEDKNLGELVDAQARGEAEAALTRLEAQYEKEVSAELQEQVVGVEEKHTVSEMRPAARRRRLIEMLGLFTSEGDNEESLSKDDHSDIAQLLMTSLDDEGQNRREIPKEWRELLTQPLARRKTVSEEIFGGCYKGGPPQRYPKYTSS